MTCTDMRENGVREVRLSPFKRGFEVGPPPPPQTTPPSDHPPPPGKYPNPSLYASFIDHFVLYSPYIYMPQFDSG